MTDPSPYPVSRLIVIGAGGHGRVVADSARRAGRTVIGFCDPAYFGGAAIHGLPVLAGDERALIHVWPEAAEAVVAIGDNARRLAVAGRLRAAGITLANVFDPAATLSPWSRIGAGAVVLAQAVVNADAALGGSTIVNTGATIEHGVQLGEGAHVGPRACVTGDARIGAGALIGSGAVILPGIVVGRGAVVGAGAVVTRDVADRAVVAGNPARPLPDEARPAEAGPAMPAIGSRL